MFLQSKYILANELVQKMDIHIANISMLAKTYEDQDDFATMVKMNNCTFIDTKANKLPANIKVGISKYEYTDMTNKLPCTWVRTEYGITEKELFNTGMVTEKVKIAGKEFYIFADEFVQKMKGKIGYVLDESETNYCLEKNQIACATKLSKNKYFTWY